MTALPRRDRSRARLTAQVSVLLCAGALVAPSAGAQILYDTVERLDSDRPEAWGMKFAAAVADFDPLDAPRTLAPGEFELGFEAGSIPSLSLEERRIGFNGTKVEEIDRGPAYGRVRMRVGLPAGFDLALGFIPPVEIDGLEPMLYSASVARTLRDRPRFRVGGFVAYQGGRLEGDITCGRDAAAAGDDPVRNPLGCEAPSRDRLEVETASAGLSASLPARRPGGFEPYASLAAHYVDGRFEVHALYAGIDDRGVLLADDVIWSVAAGGAADLGTAWRLSGEIDFTPLELRREGGDTESQSVWNARLFLARRLR
ncbi:MAG TPA: hypothetical protein VI942_11635 [Thermoanaerobaculia bacterium]|nr:hypothetical protein [Thermoanaerobaculia bacterium]